MATVTDEKIERALTNIGRIALKGVDVGVGFVFYADEVHQVLRELAQRVREQCAEKICKHCAAGESLISMSAGYISNYGDHPGGLIHYPVKYSNGGYATCDAAALLGRK